MNNCNSNENSRYLHLNEFESNATTDDNQHVYDMNTIDNRTNHHNFNIRFFHKPVLCFHCIGNLLYKII